MCARISGYQKPSEACEQFVFSFSCKSSWEPPRKRQESSRGLVTWQPSTEATMDWLPSYRTVQTQQWKELPFGQP
jgi:hypothetical protein